MSTSWVFPPNAAKMGEVVTKDDAVVDAGSWIVVDEETELELSELLDSAPPPQPIKVRFIANPYSRTAIFQSSAAYITINGNDESCGSSFSDSDSSVMASVDMGGAAWRLGGARVGEAREEDREDGADATWVEEFLLLGECLFGG